MARLARQEADILKDRHATHRTWQLAGAKNKFSEVFTRTIEEGPQHVTRRNDEIVLLSRAEYDELTDAKPKKTFIEHLLSIPKADIDFPRDKSPLRDITSQEVVQW